MAHKKSPFQVANNPEHRRQVRRKKYAEPEDPDLRPDELKADDETFADYERRKKIINTPFRKIVF